ncbi:MAG: serine protease [Chitinispirillales bacterium]|jgi:S1-C subfamily serine protease|nr:serine protease [Chitinispirillales bacterium]
MRKIFLFLPFLVFFFGLSYAEQELSVGTGTGFFINKNGVIVTCAHVIDGADKVTVRIDGIEHPALVLAKNATTDLALLKIDYRNRFHFGVTNFSNTVNLGDRVYVMGFPMSEILSSDIRLTDGIVSARSGIEGNPIYFQISAPVQPGNSGGPILSRRFNVIGVAAHQLGDMAALNSSGQLPQNVNFGVKSDYIRALLGNIAPGRGNVKNIDNATRATVQIISYSQEATITIVNRTGYRVHNVYLSLSSDNSWGSDRLGSDILENGASITIPLVQNTPAQYDIRLVDEDRDSYTKMGVRLSPNQTVEFTTSDLNRSRSSGSSSRTPSSSGTTITSTADSVAADGSTLPTVRIANRTGYTGHYLYLSPNDSDDWGDDVLGDNILPSGSTFIARLPRPLSVTNRYDIRLTDSDGDTYTQMNVLMTQNGVIDIVFGDID